MRDTYVPRPDFARDNWYSLNGTWQFAFDEDRDKEEQEWLFNKLPKEILVPFTYQTPRSGIDISKMHNIIWYKREFAIPEPMFNKRIWLKFGAVDYRADVWCNGVYLGNHEGGYTPFEFEITKHLKEKNELLVKVTDYPDTAQPRGKQYWKEQTDRCWYIQNSGIWQNVWLEATQGSPINNIKLTPDIDTNNVEAIVTIEEFKPGDLLEIEISYKGTIVKSTTATIDGYRTKVMISLQAEDFIDELHYWTPDTPNLYDMQVELKRNEKLQDHIETYFGMRKISIDNGRILLNNSPIYLKMILDQGYWKESGLTAPDDDALRYDIEVTKAFGFNGARKHQKIEDPRYYYWADRMGLLVWGEIPSAYEYCDKEICNITRDLQEFIIRDYNHPSLITWVPLNESWGVRKILVDSCQQNFGKALYFMIKAMDSTRLVSTNDGWENVYADIVGIHDYHTKGKEITDKYTEEALKHPESIFPMGRRLFSFKETYQGEKSAFMITEYGGVALATDANETNWGYGEAEQGVDAVIARYADVTKGIMEVEQIMGFCYTQLTDVYQEVNGLLTMDHIPKFNFEAIRNINNMR
ncbi:glycoside hydrolase family 2 protein [Anaerocolumna sp. MB42-C2]|uniref:glycoside hydrolase family 2 protein n=1 Tax=Anaerocolumna sp. MB42-C2 TaxID=3070997 RepID=UPI0027DEEFF1|nr:sugar-binding domain-containing protein [Anaerocolumna sp. MB42-C2]WMJ86881.1 glycoside hydrolase family 2 TIM barrel-domain containing protein [Anaerocolumna sp. MB42-C2]